MELERCEELEEAIQVDAPQEDSYAEDEDGRTAAQNMIFERLDKITEHTSRYTSGKLAFLKNDQVIVNQAIADIKRMLMAQARKENNEEKEKNRAEIRQMMRECAERTAKETARAMRLNSPRETQAGNASNKETEGTKGQTKGPVATGQTGSKARPPVPTPRRRMTPQAATYAAVVGLSKEGEGSTTKEEIMKQIESGEVENGFTEVRNRRGGKVMLITSSVDKHRKLVENANKPGSTITTQPAQGTRTLKIMGVEGGLSKLELAKTIVKENAGIFGRTDEADATRAVQVISSVITPGGMNEDWVVRIGIGEANKIREAGDRINVDLRSVKVRDWAVVTRCFRCSEFGHRAIHCRKEPCCQRCGGGHAVGDCRAAVPECPNCKKEGRPAARHSAAASSCQAHQQALQRERRKNSFLY